MLIPFPAKAKSDETELYGNGKIIKQQRGGPIYITTCWHSDSVQEQSHRHKASSNSPPHPTTTNPDSSSSPSTAAPFFLELLDYTQQHKHSAASLIVSFWPTTT